MMNNPTGPVPEQASQAGDAPGDESETFTAPVSALGDAAAGDTVSVKVVSIDADSGMATLQLAADESEAPGGTDGMADEFKTSAANSQPS